MDISFHLSNIILNRGVAGSSVNSSGIGGSVKVVSMVTVYGTLPSAMGDSLTSYMSFPTLVYPF